MSNNSNTNAFYCPTLPRAGEHITLAHGGGGQLSQDLMQQVIGPAFGKTLQGQTDSALLPWSSEALAFTTDSYVINPTFFPGGHIGQLAVIGTANDLAMNGAQLQYLSCSLIIEEGFEIVKLEHILRDMQLTAEQIGAQIVTGDTKVLEHGKGDGLFINTTGIGKFMSAPNSQEKISPKRIQVGDMIIVSGDIGRHGACIMALRDGIDIPDLNSDLSFLGDKVQALLTHGIQIHCLRDLTRGGLTSALYECAQSSKLSFRIQGDRIPISSPVQNLCELTGIDPLHLANEGRFALFCPPEEQAHVLAMLAKWEDGKNAKVIGQVTSRYTHTLVQETAYGTERIITPPLGDQFPRIC
jgi:hydrogenase expression/formation protein HypE